MGFLFFLVWLVLAGLKWSLFVVVVLLGVGKAVASLASWIVNNICEGTIHQCSCYSNSIVVEQ